MISINYMLTDVCFTGGLQISRVTFAIIFNISYSDMKPHIAELDELIAHELDVNTSQVRK